MEQCTTLNCPPLLRSRNTFEFSLGWIMFGGLEDGAKIVPEPLLDADIIVNMQEKYALLKVEFAVVAPAKAYDWGEKDRHAFDGLEQALAEAHEQVVSAAAAGTEAAEASLTSGFRSRKEGSFRRGRKRVLRKKKGAARQRNRSTGESGKHEKGSDECMFLEAPPTCLE